MRSEKLAELGAPADCREAGANASTAPAKTAHEGGTLFKFVSIRMADELMSKYPGQNIVGGKMSLLAVV